MNLTRKPTLRGNFGGRTLVRFFFSLGLFCLFAASLVAQIYPTRLGDLNADDQIDVRDLVILLNHLNNPQLSTLNPQLLPYADVNEDGYLNQADVTMLRDAILGIPLPVNTRPVALEPATGSSDVGVTVRPKATFPKPIDIATLNSNNFYATFAGRRLAATITPANNGTFAWLFFHEPMPNASQIQVIVDGSTLRTRTGLPLDADGDGAFGGVMRFNFSTVSVAPIPGTVLSSRIVDPGPDLIPRTADDVTLGNGYTYLSPIAGVKVYVLGMENNVAFTDADGRFTLTNMPVGDVKVVLDGRTATNPPAGYYFPEMVMDTTFAPGITNGVMNIVDTNGVVMRDLNGVPMRALAMYLPRVASNVLQTISATNTTMITLQSNAAYNLPPEQQQYLTVEIMPGSLIGMDGQPLASAQVGVSVVPPELVRDMLPPGLLQHTFDVTVQAPGIATFATPAPMTFPNVFNAPPGTKLNFLSFDHTTGRLVIEGTATVSEDGLFVRTDPGTGITHPGWHGLAPPGVNCTGGPITGPPAGSNPNDIDGDGKPNGSDDDVDGDGKPNGSDDDVDGDGIKNDDDPDIDGDGIANNQDSDMDGDGIPNGSDPDMDGDGIPNEDDPDTNGPCTNPQVSITIQNDGPVIGKYQVVRFSAQGSSISGEYGWAGGQAVSDTRSQTYAAQFLDYGPFFVGVTFLCPDTGETADDTKQLTILEESGRQWVDRFRGSDDPNDLVEPFRSCVLEFLAAVENATDDSPSHRPQYSIQATYRPEERSYLMHSAWRIVEKGEAPEAIDSSDPGPAAGVQITWRHFRVDGSPDDAAARQAARAMFAAYPIASKPARYTSLHNTRRAIDMTISWTGTLRIKDKANIERSITGPPWHSGRKVNGVAEIGNTELHAVGASYKVFKNTGDPPHWSETGQ